MVDGAAKELVHERTIALRDEQGTLYDVGRVYAVAQADGRFGGFIEFVPTGGGEPVTSPRETTQRSVEDVAYWATGLELVYFEGALDRGLRDSSTTSDAPVAAVRGSRGTRVARFEIESNDPALPLRLMGTRTIVPGQRRRIQRSGALVYEGTLRSPSPGERGRYAFVAEFASDTAAALVANVIWNELHPAVTWIAVQGTPIVLDHAALKSTLLGAAA